jgi:hypothetical protein
MSELNFIGTLLCFVPAAYLAVNFFQIHKEINTYIQQVQEINSSPAETQTTTSRPNLTVVRCQRCSDPESVDQFPKAAAQ